MAKNHLIGAIATLVGTVIGAGILGIPYVVAKSGLLIGIIHIILIGLAVILMNLYVGEIALRTKGTHQLVGYAEKYTGKWGKWVMATSIFFGIYGALIAYLIGEGQSLNTLFGINQFAGMFVFFILMAYLIWRGLNIIEGAEIYLSAILGFLILALFFFAIIKINPLNLTPLNFSNVLLPYGVVFFALLGMAAIPELKEELIKDKKQLKKAIIIGMLIPIVVYILFSIAIIGITGFQTTELATIGLGALLGNHILILGNLFAIFSMATSFLTLGLALKWTFQYDYKYNKYLAWALTCLLPLSVALSNLTGFIQVIGISGSIAGGLGGLAIIFIHRNAQKRGDRKPEYSLKPRFILDALLFLIFTGGIIYTIVTL